MKVFKVKFFGTIQVETRPIYGVVTIELKGRSANLDVLVEEKGSRSLIGQMLLELLDLIIEPKTRKLIPNPASPEMPMMEILMATAYNSGYAVHLRSPKPLATLRASHIRETLSEIVDFGHQVVSMLRRMGTGCRKVFTKLKTIQKHYISAGINIVWW